MYLKEENTGHRPATYGKSLRPPKRRRPKKVPTTGNMKAAEEVERQITAGRSQAGGFTREQLAKWGIPWPPYKGWRKALVDTARRTGNTNIEISYNTDLDEYLHTGFHRA